MSVQLAAWCLLTLMAISPLLASEAMSGPPGRPAVFKNPGQLREYLKELYEYFAIVGRPRFGKRSLEEGITENQAAYKVPSREEENILRTIHELLFGSRK